MKGLGMIPGQYLSAPWTLGVGVQDLASAGTQIFGSRRCSNGIFCSFEPNIQLREVTLWYLESLCTLPNHLGRLPLLDVVFSSYEGGVSNIGLRIRKHSRISTKASQMVKYWRLMVTLSIYELGTHSVPPKYANLQV